MVSSHHGDLAFVFDLTLSFVFDLMLGYALAFVFVFESDFELLKVVGVLDDDTAHLDIGYRGLARSQSKRPAEIPEPIFRLDDALSNLGRFLRLASAGRCCSCRAPRSGRRPLERVSFGPTN